MKERSPSPGRWRRVVGRCVLSLGVVVAGVWVWSGWFGRVFKWEGGSLGVSAGVVSLCERPGERPGLGMSRAEVRMVVREMLADMATRERVVPYQESGLLAGRWEFRSLSCEVESPHLYWMEASFWPLPVALLVGGGLLAWSGSCARRRGARGGCRGCGYDMAGLGVGAVCPECGVRGG